MKKHKRFFAILLCIVFAMTMLAGCGGGGSDAPAADTPADSGGAAPAASDDPITIGFLHHDVGMTPYTTQWAETFDEYCKEMGVKGILMDAQGDPVTQFSQMESMILEGVDIIVLWATDGQAIVPAMKQAYDAGIPIISTNSPPAEEGYQYLVCHVGPDDYTQGVYSVEMMAEALGEEGGKIVHITGTPGYYAAIKRIEGVHDALERFPQLELIDEQTCNWDRIQCESVMADLLTKYDEIDGAILCMGDLASGPESAIKAAGRWDEGIVLVGQTMMMSSYDLMASGNTLLFGDEEQSPILECKNCIDACIAHMNGEELEFWQFFDTPKVYTTDIQSGAYNERPTW